MRRVRLVLLSAVVAALTPGALAAQNSVFGVRGVGFPVRPLSARARALAGSDGLFDRLSAVNPALAAMHPQVTAAANMSTDLRRYDAFGTAVDGLQETRFPLGIVGGPLGRLPLGYAVSVGKYAERTFDVTTSDTLMLRGSPVEVQDRITSDGGIADVRGALAWAPVAAVRIGGAVHVISGSTKLQVRRTFSDSAYRPYRQDNDAGFSGWGLSFGAHVAPGAGVQVAAAVRFDQDLDASLDSVSAGSTALPVTLSGGVLITPVTALRVTAGAEWRSWSDAQPDLSGGTRAFDTWDLAAGVQLGGPESGASRFPLRLGVRYATLPFAPPGESQAHEIGLAAGTGLPFAGNRALIDLTVERILRDGAGVSERSWLVTAGITVRP